MIASAAAAAAAAGAFCWVACGGHMVAGEHMATSPFFSSALNLDLNWSDPIRSDLAAGAEWQAEEMAARKEMAEMEAELVSEEEPMVSWRFAVLNFTAGI